MNDDGEPPHAVINLTVPATDENLEQLRMIARRYAQSKHVYRNVKNGEKETYECMSEFDNVELTVIDTDTSILEQLDNRSEYEKMYALPKEEYLKCLLENYSCETIEEFEEDVTKIDWE